MRDLSVHDGRGSATLELISANVKPDAPIVIAAVHELNGERILQLLRDKKVDLALNLECADDLDLLDLAPPLQWGRVPSTLSVSTASAASSPILTLALR